MTFPVEKYISNFIKNQFPSFYEEEGENFVLFMQAYYEWLETDGNAVGESRNLFDYRDIDLTIQDFLVHFQQKYLYGIPFNIISNKRFLLKHILDIYRSKGTYRCYQLLFKLLYNEDVEIYLPSYDMLKASDGTWVEPKYLEVTDSIALPDIKGRQVVGSVSNTVAIVEHYIREPVNNNLTASLYLSNILPKGGSFSVGEKLLNYPNTDLYTLYDAPAVIGSLNHIQIISGGDGFNVGDVLSIAEQDPDTGQVISIGVGGKLKVANTARSQGTLEFFISESGSGYTQNSSVYFYKAPGDNAGHGAGFSLGPISYVKNLQYNTDLIIDYKDTVFNATQYNFPLNPSANSSTTLLPGHDYPLYSIFSFSNNNFGSIYSLTNINPGNNYIFAPNIFVKSAMQSKALAGPVSYANTANTITGLGTSFTSYFNANDVIGIQANATNYSTLEFQIIKSVDSDTQITLYGPPKFTSTVSAEYFLSPTIVTSQFALYEPVMYMEDGTTPGNNAIIGALPNNGNNIVSEAIAYDSGKGYLEGEVIKAYLFNGVTVPQVVKGGTGYSNGEQLVFLGGTSSVIANGFITTNTSGGIVQTTLINQGANYYDIPQVSVATASGTGAILTTSISSPNNFNTYSVVVGKVVKSAIGIAPGYWSTTRSFLNSDKYIQDSYFYQDYSYQLKVAKTLDKYKNIIYDTFHSSGTELFGEYLSRDLLSSNNYILGESNYLTYPRITVTIDLTSITIDNTYITADEEYASGGGYFSPLTTDGINISIDTTIITADATQNYY